MAIQNIDAGTHALNAVLRLGFGHTTGQTVFTLSLVKNGLGNQATTGVAVAEPDSSNNPGQYVVTVSGGASFISAPGTYQLRVVQGSDEWHFRVRVTANGAADGSLGSALFTATSGDGRVVDSANVAINEATIVAREVTSGQIYTTETDVNGDWSLWLEDGSWSITARKASFSQAGATVTVTSGTAVGPSSNIQLSSVTSGTLTLSELLAFARRQALDSSGSAADTDLTRAINDALRRASQDDAATGGWSWWDVETFVDLQAPYATGTVTGSGTTLTLASGTWPAWAASGHVIIGSRIYEVGTRDSDTVLTMARPIDYPAGTAYKLVRIRYDLPSDIARIIRLDQGRDFQWTKNDEYREILRYAAHNVNPGANQGIYAVRKRELWLWPFPSDSSAVGDLILLYRRYPAKLVSDSDVADWDDMHEPMLRSWIVWAMGVRGIPMRGDFQNIGVIDQTLDVDRRNGGDNRDRSSVSLSLTRTGGD